MSRIVLVAVLCVCFSLTARPALSWSEGGHHLIAVMAYGLLKPAQQKRVMDLLSNHPRFAQDFMLTQPVNNQIERNYWVVGRAGYWPDIARDHPEYNRPLWHFQLGATLFQGSNINVPQTPGPLPANATLDTQELHVAQAIDLCRLTLRSSEVSDANKALALCWIIHLVGDAHQPCHAGSLYIDEVFPNGDRGANDIPVRDSFNLHAYWDNLPGNKFDAIDLTRRAQAIINNRRLMTQAQRAATASQGLNPVQWLAESSELGRSHVYAPEILNAVEAARRSGTSVVEEIRLSEEYQQNAHEIAQHRVAFAAHRLAKTLQTDLPR